VQEEQGGLGVRRESDRSSRITPATEIELKLEEDAVKFEMANPDENAPQDDFVSTVRIMDLTTTALVLLRCLARGIPCFTPNVRCGSAISAGTLPLGQPFPKLRQHYVPGFGSIPAAGCRSWRYPRRYIWPWTTSLAPLHDFGRHPC
jgi:hypothetical protein